MLGATALVLGLIVGGAAGWSLMLMWCVAVGLFVVSTIAVTLSTVAFRLADPRRFIALSDDRAAVLDVVALTRKNQRLVRLENHARLPSSESAAPLRQEVSGWVLTLHSLGRRLDTSAQNLVVARLYERQFPNLIVIGKKDRWGHVRLDMKTDQP